MNPQNENAEREAFQLERIALFSDAVFAIAITLLILEITVPKIEDHPISDRALWEVLVTTAPQFIGFIISFLVIGLYWQAHHRLFRYIDRINHPLIRNNQFFLLPIVIMPFTTSFLSEYYSTSLKLPIGVYMLNICVAGLLNFRLWNIISSRNNHYAPT